MAKLTKEQVNQLCIDNITNYVCDKLRGLDDEQYRICIEDNLIDLFINIPIEQQNKVFENYISDLQRKKIQNTTNKPINAKAYLTEIGWLQKDGSIDNHKLDDDDPGVSWFEDEPFVCINGTEIHINKIVALGHYLSNYVKD